MSEQVKDDCSGKLSFVTSKIPGMFISTSNEQQWACHQGILLQLHVNLYFPFKILISACIFKNKVHDNSEINKQADQKYSFNMLSKQ